MILGESNVVHSYTTSDSEPSDAEQNSSDRKNREKNAKLRITALTLLIVISKVS